jgi:hypothetical protein
MTSDRRAKKAARARVAATGERYTRARREVVRGARPVTDPPDIEPAEHAIRTVSWGAISHHLVHHQGRYYVWRQGPEPGDSSVCQVPDEAAGHALLDERHVYHLTGTPWDQQAAHIYLPPGRGSTRTAQYRAAVVTLASEGQTWFGCMEGTEDDPVVSALTRFDDVSAALAAFADHASKAAARAALAGDHDTAAALSDHAAIASSNAGRASQEYLPTASPPGIRLPDTPVRTHATHVVDGKQYAVVSYRDTAGVSCVAVDVDGDWGWPQSGLRADDRNLLSYGLTMGTRGHGIAVIFGVAHASVTGLHAVMKDGMVVDWPVHDDQENGERYFAVITDCEAVADIVATAPAARASLQQFFPASFSKES